MWTRRAFLGKSLWVTFGGFSLISTLWNFVSNVWAKAKQLLPKGFPKNQLLNMNPAEIDNRNLEIDPLDQFGTMGPTDVAIRPKNLSTQGHGKSRTPAFVEL